MKTAGLATAIADVVANGNCSGCGACASLFSAVTMRLDSDGFIRPTIEEQAGLTEHSPSDTKLFKRTCPGVGIAASSTRRPHSDPIIGPFTSAWSAHATDTDVRTAGSSGGVITALTAWLMETGDTDAVVARASRANPSRTVPVRITSREEAFSAAGSRYAPTSSAELMGALGDGSVFVGKPCEVAAVRQYVDNSTIQGQEARPGPVRISFFCAGTPSQFATDKLVADLLPRGAQPVAVRYRGDGWPGRFVATAEDGTSGALSYEESWGQVLGRHLQPRCKLCIDGTGEDADIAVGDYWDVDERGYPRFDDQDGSSIAIARTARGHELLLAAGLAGVISLKPIDLGRLASIQPLQRDRGWAISGRLLGRVLAGRKVPHYRGFGLVGRFARHPILNFRALVGTWLRTMRGQMR